MVKRLFVILIAATMLSTSFPINAFAKEINDNGQPVTTDDVDEDNEDLIDQIVEKGLANQNNNPSDTGDANDTNDDLPNASDTGNANDTNDDLPNGNTIYPFASDDPTFGGDVFDGTYISGDNNPQFSEEDLKYYQELQDECIKYNESLTNQHPEMSALIFGYVDGNYTEKLVSNRVADDSLTDEGEQPQVESDSSWHDEEGYQYTKIDNNIFEDAEGNTYFIDINYVDPNYGAIYAVSEESVSKAGKKLAQDYIGVALDAIGKANPALAPLITTFKPLVGFLFGLDGDDDPNAKVLNKLDDIDKHLDTMEANLKSHEEDLVTFTDIGSKFQDVADAYAPLHNKIGDITHRYNANKITKEEFNRQIGALYGGQEYNVMAGALAGATNAYRGNTSFSLEENSIFSSAYNLQCAHVMFSGEAIDDTAPYLLRQLCTYIKGYSLINTVLDSLEACNGPDYCKVSRDDMLKNLGGIDNGEYDENAPGVFGLYNDYFNSNRFIYVNKTSESGKHVQVSGKLGYCGNPAGEFFDNKVFLGDDIRNTTPEIFKPIPPVLMDPLYAYCKAKNISLYSFLIDKVGFEIEWEPDNQLDYQAFKDNLRNVYVFMPHGIQCLKYWKIDNYFVNGIDAVNMNKVGAAAERLWGTWYKYSDWRYYCKGQTFTANDGAQSNDVKLLYFKPADN